MSKRYSSKNRHRHRKHILRGGLSLDQQAMAKYTGLILGKWVLLPLAILAIIFVPLLLTKKI